MKRLALAAIGLALVVGIVVGGIVGNPFADKASASTAAVGGRLIELGTIQVPPHTNAAEYAMVDVRDCAGLYAMFRASDYVSLILSPFPTSPDGSTPVGAANFSATTISYDGHMTASGWVQGQPPYVQPVVGNNSDTITTNITGWLWCAMSPTYAVGGIAELPPLASAPGAGGSGIGGTTYAVLAGAAAGVLAFAVLGTLAVKRRGVR
jgi:hypothetical protein